MKPLVRVVKVGGSLFDLPDLAARLKQWVAAEPIAVNLLLAGGGELADVIRRADERHLIGEQVSHWLCVDTLSITAKWLARVVELPLCDDWTAFCAGKADAQEAMNRVLDPRRFLQGEAKAGSDALPQSWQVTSDSIAARLAYAIDADELVLLKSLPAPPFVGLNDLARAGFVDEFFPRAAGPLKRVRFVDLRG